MLGKVSKSHTRIKEPARDGFKRAVLGRSLEDYVAMVTPALQL